MNTMPAVPTPDPCDHRVSSAPVLIQTVSGEWYTARWVVYVDQDVIDGIPPCWELVGREGLQLDREEVVQWFDCAALAALIEEVDDLLATHPAASTYPDGPCIEREQRKSLRAALARVQGGAA